MSKTIKVDDTTHELLETQAKSAGMTFRRSGDANLSGYVRALALGIQANKLGLKLSWLEAPEDGERVPVVTVDRT